MTCPHAVVGIGANVAWYFNQFILDTGLKKVAMGEGEGRICMPAGHVEALRDPGETVCAAGKQVFFLAGRADAVAVSAEIFATSTLRLANSTIEGVTCQATLIPNIDIALIVMAGCASMEFSGPGSL